MSKKKAGSALRNTCLWFLVYGVYLASGCAASIRLPDDVQGHYEIYYYGASWLASVVFYGLWLSERVVQMEEEEQ